MTPVAPALPAGGLLPREARARRRDAALGHEVEVRRVVLADRAPDGRRHARSGFATRPFFVPSA